MTSLGSVLKNEITRLARKEVRAQVEPLRKANSTYRREIAELKRQVAALGRQGRAAARPATAPAKAPAEGEKLRFSAKGLQSLRKRLGLSAGDFARLAGVSAPSIYNWESGKAVPRQAQVAALAGLRSLGKREAQRRLDALDG
jgi:DNA-binding XRE family transcriptional regulator